MSAVFFCGLNVHKVARPDRWWLKCSLNYDDLVCNNFYDIWGEFPEATHNERAFPALVALQRMGPNANDNREVRRSLTVQQFGLLITSTTTCQQYFIETQCCIFAVM